MSKETPPDDYDAMIKAQQLIDLTKNSSSGEEENDDKSILPKKVDRPTRIYEIPDYSKKGVSG